MTWPGLPSSDDEPLAWWGLIHGEPDTGTVDVVIPDLHPSKAYTAPYTPQPGPVEPQPGDRCLVIFDNDGDPWVVMFHAAA